MTKFLDRLEEGPVKEWYSRYGDERMLAEIERLAGGRRHSLDTNSGLYLKPHFSEYTMNRLGHTHINIIFPRPSDYHLHARMGEAIKCVGGKGAIYLEGSGVEGIGAGWEMFIAPGVRHAFRPNQHGFLELDIGCTMLYTPDEETTLARFDQFQPWVDYFKLQLA